MSLNDGTLDLGAIKGPRNRQPSLKGQLQPSRMSKQNFVCVQCVQCMTAPAFETRRKAVRNATLSVERAKGSAQAANLRMLLR